MCIVHHDRHENDFYGLAKSTVSASSVDLSYIRYTRFEHILIDLWLVLAGACVDACVDAPLSRLNILKTPNDIQVN